MGVRTPTWAELSKAQTRLKSVLRAVIHEGKVVPLCEDSGNIVAYVVPADVYRKFTLQSRDSANPPVLADGLLED